jgi:hypothetical protein
MKNHAISDYPTVQCSKVAASLVAVALTVTAALPQAARRDRIAPPIVPADIQVQNGYKPFLLAHAVGTQSYMCQVSGSAFKWVPVGPQATLFDDDGEQVLTHFLSPNPSMGNVPFATWQHSRDTSSVWAQKISESSDPEFVAPGAIPWFLLWVNGELEGPAGGDKLTLAVYIHRVNTTGGKEPSTGCSVLGDVNGSRKFVPYTADYYFYSNVDVHD